MVILDEEDFKRVFENITVIDAKNMFKNCLSCPCQDKTNSNYTICTSKNLCRFQSHCLGGVYLCEKDD